MDYDVMLGGASIGKVQVTREGLYSRITARCRLTGEVMYKLFATDGEAAQDLGIFVPNGSAFEVRTKIATKHLPNHPQFEARPKKSERAGLFVPLSPQEPFAYIKRLEAAYLEKRRGILGICFTGPDNQTDQQCIPGRTE